jgi:serine protease Do
MGIGGGAAVTTGAAEATDATGAAAGAGSATTGTGDEVTAHHRTAPTKSAAPRAGSHIGVRGSSSSGAAWGSLMARCFYHMLARDVAPSKAPDRALQSAGAMLRLVKRAHFVPASVLLVCVASPAGAQPRSSPALPPLPGQFAPPSEGGPASAAITPQELYEHVRRGVVAIEKNGVPLAVGTVLGGDGRILTALSGLGGAEGADVRYADGTTVHATVGHADKDADLALLVPQAGKWLDGLTASDADPAPSALRAMLPTRGAHVGPVEAALRGRIDAHARDGMPLLQMLDVELKGPAIAGAPLLDAAGSVVGVLVRACKGAVPVDSPWTAWGHAAPPAAKASCTPVVLGESVTAIRTFLSRTLTNAVAPSPWLGIRGEAATEGATRGVRLTAVAPQSPAEGAGLKPNADVIVAVDGQPIDGPQQLAQAIGRHAPGDTVKLLVFGDGEFREVPVALRAAP